MATEVETSRSLSLVDAFERLSPKAKDLLRSGITRFEQPTLPIVRRLAQEGLTLDECVEICRRGAGPWRGQYNSRITDEEFAAEIKTVWREGDFGTVYGKDREKFHDVSAKEAMAEVVYPAGANSASQNPQAAWVNQEEAAQEVATAAGVRIEQQPAPVRAEEAGARLAVRGQELVEKVGDATVRVPRDRSYFDRNDIQQFIAIRDQVRQREDQAVATMLSRDQRDHVMIADGKHWASLIVSGRAAREKKAARPNRLDLDEKARRAHEAAVTLSRISYSGVRWMTWTMKMRESLLETPMGGESRAHRTGLSYHKIASAVVGRELQRYDIALAKAGISREQRAEMVVREARIRAAEYGIGLDVARKKFDGRLRGYQSAVQANENRLAGFARNVERQQNRRSAPARDLSSLSPEQLKAHGAAVAAAGALNKLQTLKAIEESRAFTAREPGGAAMTARGRTKLTRSEATLVIVATEIQTYEASLRRSGLDDRTITEMVARERQHREAVSGLAPSRSRDFGAAAIQSREADLKFALESNLRNHLRVDALATEISRRDPEAADLSGLNLTEAEMQIRQEALQNSWIEVAHVAGMIRNEEVDRARLKLGERGNETGRDFFNEWEANALSKEEAARLVHDVEISGYRSLLNAARLSEERIDRLVGYEDESRRRDLGLPSASEERRSDAKFETAREHYDRFERLADIASSSAFTEDELELASRLSRNEIKSLAGELEFAAREAYARDNSVTLSAAATIVKISPEELRHQVETLERGRKVELQAEQQAEEERRTAAQKEARDAAEQALAKDRARERRQEILDRPLDHANEFTVLRWEDKSHATLTFRNTAHGAFDHWIADQDIKRARFTELAGIQKEMDPISDASQLRQSRQQTQELFQYMKANGIEPHDGAGRELFDRIDKETNRLAEHETRVERDRSAGMSMSM
jgi:hypothetical protein